MKKIAITLLGRLSVYAHAAEKQATLNPKEPCVIVYPRTSLLNEEQGTLIMSLLIAPGIKIWTMPR